MGTFTWVVILVTTVATLPAAEVFSPSRISTEINRRYGKHLRRPASARMVSNALRRLAAEDGGGVDLVLTDVVMPGGMNGQQLAVQAQALRPSLKVLFTSGYTEHAMVHQGRLEPRRSGDRPHLRRPRSRRPRSRLASVARSLRSGVARVTCPSSALRSVSGKPPAPPARRAAWTACAACRRTATTRCRRTPGQANQPWAARESAGAWSRSLSP